MDKKGPYKGPTDLSSQVESGIVRKNGPSQGSTDVFRSKMAPNDFSGPSLSFYNKRKF
jgi:hypothetical protein